MDLSQLSTEELLEKKKTLEKLVSKYSNTQNGRKVMLNSAYGALGNVYFRYFDVRQAEAVTLSGQLAIKWIQQDLNQYLNKLLGTENQDFVIASDTDSVYLNLEQVVLKTLVGKELPVQKVIDFLDAFCEQGLQKKIEQSFKNLYDYTNGFLPRMEMKRETLADRGIWVAKKRYVVNAIDVEGVRYQEPEVKATGLDVVKSSTPSFVKEYLYEALRILLQEDQKCLQDFVKNFKKIYNDAEVNDIAFPKTVNGLDKYSDSKTIYAKSCPINTRASLLYNHYIKKLDLSAKYQKIEEKEKIRYVYLKTPNTIGEDVIGFIDQLPIEFNLHKYIDYDTQFDKMFRKPIEDIANCIGWSLENKKSLF
jgi:DNA polymerase elongation subunit (family B)